MKTVTVTTEKMGSCQCGDCYCEIRNDGAIRYCGKMDWQKSEWVKKPVFPQTYRPYASQLTKEAYHVALKRLMEIKMKELTKIGNAEFVETIDINGGICVGDHCAADYPQAKWESTAETADGEKVIITYVTDREDAKIAAEHGWDQINWNSKITKIELEEGDK